MSSYYVWAFLISATWSSVVLCHIILNYVAQRRATDQEWRLLRERVSAGEAATKILFESEGNHAKELRDLRDALEKLKAIPPKPTRF